MEGGGRFFKTHASFLSEQSHFNFPEPTTLEKLSVVSHPYKFKTESCRKQNSSDPLSLWPTSGSISTDMLSSYYPAGQRRWVIKGSGGLTKKCLQPKEPRWNQDFLWPLELDHMFSCLSYCPPIQDTLSLSLCPHPGRRRRQDMRGTVLCELGGAGKGVVYGTDVRAGYY